MSWVKIGVSASSPITTPAWREEIVQPPWIACGARPCSAVSVSAESTSARPEADQDLGREGEHDQRLGQQRQAAEAAGDEDRAGGGAGRVLGTERADPPAAERRQRHHR